MDLKKEFRMKKFMLHYKNKEVFLKPIVRNLSFCTKLSSKSYYSQKQPPEVLCKKWCS